MAVVIDIKEEILEIIKPLEEKIEEIKKTINNDDLNLLNRQDLAKLFKVRPESIDRWVRQGNLPQADYQIGGVRYWERKNIKKFLSSK